jgi:hypothetical protein
VQNLLGIELRMFQALMVAVHRVALVVKFSTLHL